MNTFKSICIAVFGAFGLLGQETNYYNDFNKAYEIITTNINNKEVEVADSIFKILFDNNVNHHLSDIINVINHRGRNKGGLQSFYINTLVKTAKKYKNYKRESNYLHLTKHEFNLIKRKLDVSNNYKRKTLSLLRMIVREQRARKKKQNIVLADSLNAIEVKKMLSDTNLIRNLTYMDKQFLELLIMHGGIRLYEQDLELIRYYIGNKRYLSRDLMSKLIERDAVFGGITYKVLNNKLKPNDKNQMICPFENNFNLFYSNIGETPYNINNKLVYVPMDPDLSLEEINQVRSYCYLPKFIPKSNEHYVFPSAEEWCEIVKDKE